MRTGHLINPTRKRMRACSAGRLPYTGRHSVTHPKARSHHWVMTADHRQGACLIRRGCGRWWCGAGAGLFAGPGATPITPGRIPYQFGRRAFRYKSRTPGSISAASRSRGVSYLSEQLGARSYHEGIHQSCLPAPLTPDPAMKIKPLRQSRLAEPFEHGRTDLHATTLNSVG